MPPVDNCGAQRRGFERGSGAGVYLKLLLLTLIATVAACGGGGGSSTAPPSAAPAPAADCSVDGQKDFVLAVAQDWYRWYDELADEDPADFDTANAYLRALTAPLAEDFRDPGFSFLTTREADQANLSTGAFVGFGFRFAIDDAGRYLISDVFENGAAFDGGFVRGAEMLAVDTGEGFRTFREFEQQGASISEVFGPAELGLERGFRLLIDGQTLEVRIAKRELDVPPLVGAPRSIERPGLSPVGYLHLRSFTTSANPELEAAFAELASQDVTDFIIDLRYNGGGAVSVAERFLDLLGGNIAQGRISYTLSFNDKRTDEDRTVAFSPREASASPLRIAFITSDATASASELMINSMSPHVEMVLVGSDTLGKAVGQSAFDQVGCDTRLRLVTFEVINGEGLGGFYTGLVDTGRFTLCAAEDRYAGAFGSADEALIAASLDWLNEGVCESLAPSSIKTTQGIRRAPFPLAPDNLADRRSLWVQ